MSIVAIETALEQHLLALTNLPEIAWEDVSYTPVVGVPYVSLHHLHNAPRDLSLERGLTEYPGIFQVSVMHPAGMGKVTAKQLAQRIADHFSPVLLLSAGNHSVEIGDTPHISSGQPTDDGWYLVPVSISWRAMPM